MTRVRRAAALLVLLLAAVPTAAPAVAAPGDLISFSADGRVWASTLDGALFDPDDRWVPGDTATRSFRVRNDGPSSARLTVRVEGTDTGRLLAHGDIALAARAAGQPWVALRNGVPSTALTEAALAQRGVARIDLRATFLSSSTNRSEVQRLPLRFVVTLTQAAAASTGSTGTGGTGRTGTGVLPQTGAEIALWTVWVCTGLLAAGLFLAGRRRTPTEGAPR